MIDGDLLRNGLIINDIGHNHFVQKELNFSYFRPAK